MPEPIQSLMDDERLWAMYASAGMSTGDYMDHLAIGESADKMLVEHRKRFVRVVNTDKVNF